MAEGELLEDSLMLGVYNKWPTDEMAYFYEFNSNVLAVP